MGLLWLKPRVGRQVEGMLLEYATVVCVWLIALVLTLAVDATPAPNLGWWLVAVGVALSVSFDV